MKLCADGLKDGGWEKLGVRLPRFDYKAVSAGTIEKPIWIHYGAGNIFRGFIASLQQRLIDGGYSDKGIIAAEGFDHEIIDRIYAPHDNLSLLVGLRPDGSTDKSVIGSIAGAYKTDSEGKAELERMFCEPGLQIFSFAITEKGYSLVDFDGNPLPGVTEDFENPPHMAKYSICAATALLYKRYEAGAMPLAVLCLDNFSGNGDRLKAAVMAVAEGWRGKGVIDGGFIDYLNDRDKISFPWTMIDKITPRPSEKICRRLEDAGLLLEPIVTGKGTYIAPYVNAEIPQYLVVEDDFPNGRPCLEEAGVYFAGRETVNKAERMKVTACLNPLHTALAIFGRLLGFDSIAEEMGDEDLRRLVECIGYAECLPVVEDPGIIDPREFLKEVLTQRLPNPFMPDTPQRVASDTSQKMPIRFGETIKAYAAREDLGCEKLVCIPLTIAAWFRYLLGLDDRLEQMRLSDDPLMDRLREAVSGIEAARADSYNGQLTPLLSDSRLFGMDLYEAGIGGRVERLFVEMLRGRGAVRRILHNILGGAACDDIRSRAT
ncbi:MAG: mannitol dehydrogenase family protein [Clostridiales Family XIII bacterium]|nr:mannitol dehydrogenase family protein [Clostridiales Family XIII bacterium]